ncbi:hypothetical protein U1Q18_033094 [Sarracenia purpurea var. burkii]
MGNLWRRRRRRKDFDEIWEKSQAAMLQAAANCDQRVLQYYKLSDRSEIEIIVRPPEWWIWTRRITTTDAWLAIGGERDFEKLKNDGAVGVSHSRRWFLLELQATSEDEERRQRGFQSLVFSPVVFRFRGTTKGFIEEVVLVDFTGRRLALALAKEA